MMMVSYVMAHMVGPSQLSTVAIGFPSFVRTSTFVRPKASQKRQQMVTTFLLSGSRWVTFKPKRQQQFVVEKKDLFRGGVFAMVNVVYRICGFIFSFS